MILFTRQRIHMNKMLQKFYIIKKAIREFFLKYYHTWFCTWQFISSSMSILIGTHFLIKLVKYFCCEIHYISVSAIILLVDKRLDENDKNCYQKEFLTLSLWRYYFFRSRDTQYRIKDFRLDKSLGTILL